MKPVLVGIGELLWDLLPEEKRFGGAPANVACHFQRLGGKGITVSAAGTDDLGMLLIDQLQALSLSNEFIALDKYHPTGTVSITLDHTGIPSYNIQENVAWDFIPSTSRLRKLAKKTDAVVFGTLAQRSPLSRQTIREFVSSTKSQACCIFDINLRYPFYSRENIEASLPLANILKLNDDELHILAEMLSLEGSDDKLMTQLLKRYKLSMIALTRGEQGSTLYSGSEWSVHPGYHGRVVDTVGAGDAFVAALALGILKGQNLDTINDNANRLAAYVCSMPGATPELSKDILALMKDI